MKKYLLFKPLLMLCFITMIGASPVKVTEFFTSYSIDRKDHSAEKISLVFAPDTRVIYASATIHDIFPSLKFKIRWYRYKGEKAKALFDYGVTVKGTQFVYFGMKAPPGGRFEKGKYRIDILLSGEPIAKTFFMVGESAKKDLCPPSGVQDDRLMSVDMIRLHPKVKGAINTFGLRRFEDGRKRFSLIVPAAWEKVENRSKGRVLYLQRPKQEGSLALYQVRFLPLERRFLSVDAKKLVRAACKVIERESNETGARLSKGPKIYSSPATTVADLELARSAKGMKFWELHRVIFDGTWLYDIEMIVDAGSLEVGRFLCDLAAYSFWSESTCR